MHHLYTDDVVNAALAELPLDVRDEFAQSTGLAWIRGTTLDAVVSAVGRQLGRTSDSVYDELMRHGSQRWFRTMWRVLLNLVTDQALVSRAGIIYGRTRNVGTMTGAIVGPGRAEMLLVGWPMVPDRAARNFALGMEAILLASGRVDAKVRWERMADGAKFLAMWRVK